MSDKGHDPGLASTSTPLLAQDLANHLADPGRAPLEGLRLVAELRRRLDDAEVELVVVARQERYRWGPARHDWREIADALGVSKTAAHRKHGRHAYEQGGVGFQQPAGRPFG